MSFQAIAWAVRQKLPCTQKIVLVMLADRHNGDTGRCDPSHDRLADDCGLTRRSVMDQLAKLDSTGFIRTHHRVIGKLKTSNQYTLMLGFGVPADVKEFHIEVQQVPQVVQQVHQGSEHVAHKPGKEPVKEPIKEKKSADAPAPRPAKAGFPIPDGIESQAWADWMLVRKAKRAPMTETAWNRHGREAEKAGISPNAAVVACVEYNWQGFDAGWYAERQARQALAESGQRPAPRSTAPAETFRERDARLQREEWERSTGKKWPEQDLPASARRQPAPAPYTLEAETRRLA